MLSSQVQIQNKKVDISKVSAKCGSKANIKHKPGGGDVKIESQKLNFKEKAQAKVGSLDNVGHLPAGGAVKVVSGHDGDAAGRGGVVESGSQQVGAVTAPRSPQESCFLLTVAVFSSSVISRGRGRRGGGPGWRQPSPETMACLTF